MRGFRHFNQSISNLIDCLLLFLKFTFRFIYCCVCATISLRLFKMWKGALSRLVYVTAYSSISFFLPLPQPSPFIYSTTGPFIIIIFSFSLIIPLSSRLSLLEFRSMPFIPLYPNSCSLPLRHFFLSFHYAFPSLLSAVTVLRSPTGKKKKEENRGARRELYQQENRRRDAGGVATPPKMLMRQSIRDFHRRKNSSASIGVFINHRKFILIDLLLFLWSHRMKQLDQTSQGNNRFFSFFSKR